MKGNYGSGRRPSLKKRLESIRRQNAAIGQRDKANRCGTCQAPLTGQVFTLFSDPRRFCSALCVPSETTGARS